MNRIILIYFNDLFNYKQVFVLQSCCLSKSAEVIENPMFLRGWTPTVGWWSSTVGASYHHHGRSGHGTSMAAAWVGYRLQCW
jgi:hypothetical protein